ncbi:MAG: 2'-5' RNA ligase family protein [Nitrospirota bacterium]
MLHEHRETVPSVVREYPEWHRGRDRYSIWLIRLESDDVLSHVESARKHLSDLLLRPYLRQPHITVFVCGFPTHDPVLDDDYGTAQFRQHTQALRNAEIGPFPLEIAGLNSFASAPFLEVVDREGGLERIRGVLGGSAPEVEAGRYVPHVTVGLYAGAFPSGMVRRRMDVFRLEPCLITVEKITFAHYGSRDIAGPLEYGEEVLLTRDRSAE